MLNFIERHWVILSLTYVASTAISHFFMDVVIVSIKGKKNKNSTDLSILRAKKAMITFCFIPVANTIYALICAEKFIEGYFTKQK